MDYKKQTSLFESVRVCVFPSLKGEKRFFFWLKMPQHHNTKTNVTNLFLCCFFLCLAAPNYLLKHKNSYIKIIIFFCTHLSIPGQQRCRKKKSVPFMCRKPVYFLIFYFERITARQTKIMYALLISEHNAEFLSFFLRPLFMKIGILCHNEKPNQKKTCSTITNIVCTN